MYSFPHAMFYGSPPFSELGLLSPRPGKGVIKSPSRLPVNQVGAAPLIAIKPNSFPLTVSEHVQSWLVRKSSLFRILR